MRFLLIAVSLAACHSDSQNLPTDLARPPEAPQDLGPPTACGAIWSCVFPSNGMPSTVAQCEAGKLAAARTAFDAAIGCMLITYCGGQVDDASPSMKCAPGMVTTDAGLSTCNQCVDNTVNGPNSFFVDKNGQHMPCVPDNAPECGACVSTAYNCLTQCFSDADCAGFNTPLTCMNASGSTPGTCG